MTRRRRWIALGCVLLAAALTRLPHLTADLPLDVEHTNAPSLDAYWYLVGALERLSGHGHGSDPAYVRPLHDALALPLLSLFGRSHLAACLVSALSGLLTVGLLLLAGPRAVGTRVAVLAAGMLALCYPFAMHNRSPLIYSGLAFVMTAGLVLRAHGSRGGHALAWGVAFAALFLYKVHAVALLGGLGLAWGVEHFTRRGLKDGQLLRASLAAAALTLLLAGAVLVFPEVARRNVERVVRYLGERSPGELVRQVFNLPLTTRLGPAAPVLTLLALLAYPLLLLEHRELPPRARPVLVASAGWLGFALAAAALLDYRPLRYFTIAFPPLALLAAYTVARLLRGPPSDRLAPGAVARTLATVATLAVFYGAWAVGAHLLFGIWREPPDVLIVLASYQGLLVLAAGSTLVTLPLILGRTRVPPRRQAQAGRLALALFVLVNGARLTAYHGGPPPRSLVEAGPSLAAMLGPNALLIGPYAPALALETEIAWRDPWFRGGDVEAHRARGATHLVLDPIHARGSTLEDEFAAAGMPLTRLSSLTLRRQEVLVFRFSWAEAAGYERSGYERAHDLEQARGLVAALPAWRTLAAADPRAPVQTALTRAAVTAGELELALKASAAATTASPSSARAWWARAAALAAVGDPAVEQALARAVWLEPALAKRTDELPSPAPGAR